MSPFRGKKIENAFVKVAHVSGDSAYLVENVIRALTGNHAVSTIAASKTIDWPNQLENVDWTAWEYSLEQIEKLRKKKRKPQECYLSRWYWQPGWADQKLMLPVVIKKSGVKMRFLAKPVAPITITMSSLRFHHSSRLRSDRAF